MRGGKRLSVVLVVLAVVVAGLTISGGGSGLPAAEAVPNPVATDQATYAAYGRVFPDPQGCLSADTDGDDVNDVVAPVASPWAKGNVCVGQFLTYQEFVEGSKLLEKLYPRFIDLIRLDQAYDNPNFKSAGLGRMVATEDGKLRVLGRDRRALYMLKVTDRKSRIPENKRYHFVYSGSIHGIERAGAEGQIRAAEDLVTWGAHLPNKRIVETPTKLGNPKVGEVLRKSVIYFIFPNPDGWGRGELSPVDTTDGSPNLSYTPGVYFHRYNGNGMDLNRDWPSVGYSYRPYTPGSNPEIKAYTSVLRKIRSQIASNGPVGKRFAGGIDLHGQLDAPAFSFTLTGAGQRDFHKNFATVDQGLRTWADQTARMKWSPYIGTLFGAADQWGTVIDTLGYQVTGALGDWFESEDIGLGAVGIDNEMSLSHLAPNTVYEPALEQMHIDGNKGLIFSQIASILTERKDQYVYHPVGKVGYVLNPKRIQVPAKTKVRETSLPAQDDIDVFAPCESVTPAAPFIYCDEAGTTYDAVNNAVEFDVKGPKDGVYNGGLTVQMTNINALSISAGTLANIVIERFDADETGSDDPSQGSTGQWETLQESFTQAGNPDLYLPAGQEVTLNDPIPGRYRVRITNPLTGPARIKIDFNKGTAEGAGQRKIDASSMDFFKELNHYVRSPKQRSEAVAVRRVIDDPSSLRRYDSLVVVNYMGDAGWLQRNLKLSKAQVAKYFAGLKAYAQAGGNLVLTDAALRALPQLGVVSKADVENRRTLAGRYEFGETCNKTKLTTKVCLPGTAGGTSRQAVEPTPLGYSPDLGLDDNPARVMKEWWVKETSWNEGRCSGKCTQAEVGSGTGLGERLLGKGRVRIAGVMFPDPNYHPGVEGDMRFGLASYSLSFSAWQIFLNLVNYRR